MKHCYNTEPKLQKVWLVKHLNAVNIYFMHGLHHRKLQQQEQQVLVLHLMKPMRIKAIRQTVVALVVRVAVPVRLPPAERLWDGDAVPLLLVVALPLTVRVAPPVRVLVPQALALALGLGLELALPLLDGVPLMLLVPLTLPVASLLPLPE